MADIPPAAITAAAAAIERELMSGTDYSTAADSDEALARAALEAAAPAILREFAVRALLISEIAHGWRCPKCHGKPASFPSYGRPYRCGCGYKWTPTRKYVHDRNTTALLTAAAEGKPLPPLPPKEAPDAP